MNTAIQKNIYPFKPKISGKQRSESMQQLPHVIWFTGLSGSGKSTLACELENVLWQKGYKTYLLDGDNIRSGLNKDLDFTDEGRKENIRRIAEVAALFVDAGIIVICAFISPFESERQLVRELVGEEKFLEIYLDTPIEVCEERDVKGLYKKAREGKIANFTGIDSPYEPPKSPFLQISTQSVDIKDQIALLTNSILKKVSGQ